MVNELTTIHSCEQVTDASTSCVLTSGSGGVFTGDAGENVEGTYAYGFDLDIETHTVTFTPSSTLNLTDQILWVWLRFLTSSNLDTWENGAVKVTVSSGLNGMTWYITGNDRAGGRYTRYPIYLGSTPDSISNTTDLSAITSVVFSFTGLIKSKLTQNVFIDYLQYGAVGAGIKIIGGGVGTEETFADMYEDDQTLAAGMIDYIDGVYFMNGAWNYGDLTISNIYFEDLNQIIVSKDHYRSFTTSNRTSAESLVSSDHYQFNVQNYASGTANFVLGELAGGRGASGCTFKTGGNRPIVFDFNDTDIDILKLYGCTFINCSIFTFPTVISGSEVYDCVWNGCGEVNPSTFKFRYCNYINAKTHAVQIDSTSFDIELCNFINPTIAGIELTVAGPYTFTNLAFVGTTGSGPYDVNNTYGSTIVVNNSGSASNAQYYTGTLVTFQGSAPITITVQDEDKVVIIGAQVSMWYESIVGEGYDTEIMNEDTIAGGIASETWTGSTPLEALLKVRKSDDLDNPRYFGFSDIVTIATGTGLTRTITLKENTHL